MIYYMNLLAMRKSNMKIWKQEIPETTLFGPRMAII